MSTDAQRKASAAFHAKREAEGLKKVTLWLSPEARFKLDMLKKIAGSKDKAANAAILAWPGSPVEKKVGLVEAKDHLITEARVSWAPGHPKVTCALAKPIAAANAKIWEAKANQPHDVDVTIHKADYFATISDGKIEGLVLMGPVHAKPGSRLKVKR